MANGPHNLREAGYREVLAQAGIEPIVLTVDFHTPDEERAHLINEYLDEVGDIVDGVFATDDLSAAEVLEWAYTRKRTVPDQLKVIGFDGTSAVRRAMPGLATIRQPLADLARTAVGTLLSQIKTIADGGEIGGGPATPIILPVELFTGRTV